MTALIDPRALTHDERELVHHIGQVLWTMAEDLDKTRPDSRARHVLARMLNSDRDLGRTLTPLLLKAIWQGCTDQAMSDFVDVAAETFPSRYRLDRAEDREMIDFAWSLTRAREKARDALAEDGEAEYVEVFDLVEDRIVLVLSADGSEVTL